MFYDRFVQLCTERNISPSRAAIEAGLSKSTVTKWKVSPDSKPTGTAINKLTEYFGLSISELFGEETKNTPTADGERKDVLDEIDVAFYGDYRELTEDDKETVRDMVRVMRERRAKQEK